MIIAEGRNIINLVGYDRVNEARIYLESALSDTKGLEGVQDARILIVPVEKKTDLAMIADRLSDVPIKGWQLFGDVGWLPCMVGLVGLVLLGGRKWLGVR